MADTGNYPSEWNTSLPTGADPRREGDDEIRLVKVVVTNLTDDLDGNPSTQSLFEAMFPIGISILQQTDPGGNPSDDIGGTWVKDWEVTANTPGTTDGAKVLYMFRRTA